MKERNAKGQFCRETSGPMYRGCKIFFDRKGYACVWLNGKTQKVHLLEWESANGPKPKGHDVHHKDFDKTNFTLSNLELLSVSDHHRVHAGWLRNNEGEWTAKPCTQCGEVLNLSDFYPRKGYTPSANCKRCHNEKVKRWAERNPERRREIARRWWERKVARDGQDARA